jgi:type I restriction enzyme S subunit
MTREEFFKKFEAFADAPDAVASMRELVLELAIRGRLVRQDDAEEPAAKQLERIAVMKANGGRVRTRSRRIGSRITEESGTHIPAGWAKSTLADIVTVLNGRAYAKDELLAAGTPVLRVGNLFTSRHWYYSDLQLQPDKYCDKGDLIFAWSASFGPFIWTGPKVIYHYHIWKLDLHSATDISKDYLYWFLQNKTQEIKRAGHGVSMLHMTKERMEELEVMVPPLAEQKRIVAKVGELMALCDRLEAQTKERETRHVALARASLTRFADAPTPANLMFLFHKSYAISSADLRKSILTLAIQGKLVPQDPRAESASQLLALISNDVVKAVRSNRMRRFRPIPPYEGKLAFDLPIGWRWAPLGSLTAAEEGAMCDGPFGSKLKTEHYISTKGYAVLRLGNIGVGYFIRGKEGHISREHFESLSSNQCVPGDLLVAGLADPLVRCCEVPPNLGPAVNKSDCFRVRLHGSIDRSYVRHYLNSPVAKAFAAEDNHGMTRQRINLSSAKALPVPVPPLAEQRRIVDKVDQLMALVDVLETQLAASRATAAKLLDAIVGELTA